MIKIDTFICLLRRKAQRFSRTKTETPLRLIHLQGLLSGYDTSPETLAELRRELWADMIVRDPRFRERVAQARDSVREGRGISIEELREKHDIPSQAASDAG